jgi:hypothetical protein
MAIIYVFKRVVSISGSTVAGSFASLMPGFAKDYFHVYLYIYMFAHWQIHHDWGIYWVHTYIYNYIYILQFCILLTDPLHNITPKLLVLLLYRAQIADLGDHSFFKFLFYVVPTITGKPLFVFLK